MQRLKLFIPLAVFAVLALLFWRGLYLDPSEMPSSRLGDPVPAFSLRTVRDADVRITEDIFQGEVSLLNVWGTWCAACRIEHPFLVELAEQGMPIYGVNYKDPQISDAQQWLERLHDPYRLSVVDQDGRLGMDLGVFGAPETYVVDKQGIIRYRHVGVVDQRVWDEKLGPLVEQLRGE
ncbi:DsbE family thiol:disulfide interchange protein [Marinimicrobium sp. ARAG 43.8]|uniref:DsbE family thiol:disulfide interchange protein n=1 Tax=Marinimicrobium sp. ARAG 43.8 TaxID=3418719 RepID=UPI003CE8AC24